MTLFGHLCDICKKNRATVKFTTIGGGQVKEMLICSACNSEHNPLHRRGEEGGAAGLQSLFANLLKEKGGGEAAAKPEPQSAVCPQCGVTFESYRKTFLLGCAACYESFSEPLLADLRKIHGDTRHVGKVPLGQAQQVRQEVTIATLRQQLSEAIAHEDFEAAAQLRDQIRALEQGECGEP